MNKRYYNNPNLINKYDDVHSESAGLREENYFLKAIVTALLTFSVVVGILLITGIIIFFYPR